MTRYLDVLVDLMLVRRLMPWHGNAGKRLMKAPKVYIRDAGLAHALLGLGTTEALLGHPVVGGSWEGFCIAELIAAAPDATQASYYRTSAGAELDLVLQTPDGAVWAIEVKRTTAARVSRGFHRAADDIQADHRVLVYAGTRNVAGQGALTALPLAQAIAMISGNQTQDRQV